MKEPNFDPEKAEMLHHSIFFSGIYDHLTSENNAFADYQNLYNALHAIGAPKSEKVLGEFLEIFGPISAEGFDRLEQEVKIQAHELENLWNRYFCSNEDIPQLIRVFYEGFSD